MKRGNLTILVADDSYEDHLLLRRAFLKCAKPGVTLQMTSSGNEAVAYLRGIEPFEDRNQYPYPTFVLADLKMSDGDGFTILEHLRSTPQSTVIPTVVLSASSDSDDIKRAYTLGASAYLILCHAHLCLRLPGKTYYIGMHKSPDLRKPRSHVQSLPE
ncbi:MAG: response regulator [Gammaproteobacteria bacterium]